MSARVKPIITEESDNHIYLGVLDPRGPFPGRIYAHSMCLNDEPVIYVPQIFANVIVVVEEDDAIGYSYCSNCKKSVNIFDKYCCHCGAKLKSRKTLGDDYEENYSDSSLYNDRYVVCSMQ